jgi:predicted flap endonuclease-1-like 5' DNA nuclease
VTSFAQIAAWTDADVAAMDATVIQRPYRA